MENNTETNVLRGGIFRENNYDLLRVVATLMVILNHVADYYLVQTNFTGTLSIYWVAAVGAPAVQLFLMLSGAFVIDKVKGWGIAAFYRKSAVKLLLPVVLIIPLYYLVAAVHGKLTVDFVLHSLKTGFYGHPLWYMFMLVGIYVVIPFIALIKGSVSQKTYIYMGAGYFIWAVFSNQLDSYTASYSVGCSLGFLGFVLVGDIIRHKMGKNNVKGSLLILAGLAMLLVNYYVLYGLVENGGYYGDRLFNSRTAPLVLVGALSIFAGFGMIRLKYSVAFWAKYTFFIYLFHKIVLDGCHYIMYKRLGMSLPTNYLLEMIGEVIVIFLVSMVFSILFDKLFQRLIRIVGI